MALRLTLLNLASGLSEEEQMINEWDFEGSVEETKLKGIIEEYCNTLGYGPSEVHWLPNGEIRINHEDFSVEAVCRWEAR